MLSFLNKTSNSFEGKKSYEQVLLLLRRHWFVIFIKCLGFFFIGLIPIVLLIVLKKFVFVTAPELSDYYYLVMVLFYLFWWFGVFYAITMYLLDIWIVTDHRIIDSEQHGFFKRTTAEIHLSKIQDLSVTIAGVIPTFLDYGNLEVQSAGASEKFFFQEIPHPNNVRDTITEAHNKFIEVHPNDIEVHEQL